MKSHIFNSDTCQSANATMIAVISMQTQFKNKTKKQNKKTKKKHAFVSWQMPQ